MKQTEPAYAGVVATTGCVHWRNLQGRRQADVLQGASLDAASVFNSSLAGKVRRAIDIREGDNISKSALKKLIRQAVALNRDG